MWSRRTVKADARRQLRRCLPAAAAIALLLAVTDGSQTFQQIYQIVSGLLSYLGRWTLPPLPTLPAPVSLLVGILLFSPLQVGAYRFLLATARGETPSLAVLKTSFQGYENLVAAHLLTELKVLLWSLLLVIPGIVASYRYAMVPWILAEDPSCSAAQALQRSKEMTDGHKLEMLGLSLSFLGWMLLSLLFTLGLGLIPLCVYQAAAFANLYLALKKGEEGAGPPAGGPSSSQAAQAGEGA